MTEDLLLQLRACARAQRQHWKQLCEIKNKVRKQGRELRFNYEIAKLQRALEAKERLIGRAFIAIVLEEDELHDPN